MKRWFDSHTHNGHSRCVHEPWAISDGWALALDRGLSGLGITNHVHFNSPRQDFLPDLRAEIDAIGNPNLLLGVELDIDDPHGRIVLQDDTLNILDYVIAGPHNMPTESLAFPDIEEDEIAEYFASLRDILVASLSAGPIDVWVHPFYQELSYAGKFMHYIAPIYTECLELCAQKGIAVELTQAFQRDVVPIEKEAWSDNNSFQKEVRAIVTGMVQEAVNVPEIQFSLASDAHQIDRVGAITFPIELIQELDIKEERILKLQKKG